MHGAAPRRAAIFFARDSCIKPWLPAFYFTMRPITWLSLALTLSTQAQTLDHFEPATPTRSGLVRLYGSGFGTEVNSRLVLMPQTGIRSGLTGSVNRFRVLHIARWTDSLIEAYIPETASLGKTAVLLERGQGHRFLGSLEVKARQQGNGRVQWMFKCADQFIFGKPAVGPDGTVYTMGNFGHLYALTPDGGLKWILRPRYGVHGSVSVDQTGRVFLGGSGVQAVSPDGQELWHYPLTTPLIAGPDVGPDGNIYAVDNSRWSANVQGMVVLDRDGNLVNKSGKFYERGAGDLATPVIFDGVNAYFSSGGTLANGENPGMTAIRQGGGIRWVNPNGLLIPAPMPNGGIVSFGTSTVDRFDAAGSLMWSRSLWDFGGYQPIRNLVTTPFGQSYWLGLNQKLNGLSASGTTIVSVSLGEMASNLTSSPDGTLLALQTQPNFGVPAHLRGYSPNGQLLWQSENLPLEAGTTISVYNGMTFSADSTQIFAGSSGPYTAQNVAHCYLFGFKAK